MSDIPFNEQETFGSQHPDQLERIAVRVRGVPVPQGSKVIMRGRLVDVQSAKLKRWRKDVAEELEEAVAGRKFTGPVFVFLDFHLPRGKTVRRAKPTVKPDIDKLARSVLDAITQSGAWNDDAQVISVHAVKQYGTDFTGADIVIREAA